MNLKKYTIFSIILLSFFTSFCFLDDDMELDSLDFVLPEDTQGEMVMRAPDGSYQQFANILLNPPPPLPSLDTVLGTDLYKSTKQIRRRSILDTEIIGHNPFYTNNSFQGTLFFNATRSSCLVNDFKTLNRYLDLMQGDLPEKLEDYVQEYGTEYNITFSATDIPDLLGFLGNIKIGEAQIGCMLEYTHIFNEKWSATIKTPLLWQIYFPYLSTQERTNLEKNALINYFDTGTSFMEFARAHLLSDKIGLGDIELRAEYTLYQRPTSLSFLGFSLGIPSKLTLKKGVFGSYFPKDKLTTLNLEQEFIDPLVADNLDTLQNNGKKLALSILDHISSVLLEHPLSRDNHWFIGLYSKSSRDFTPNLTLSSVLHCKIPLPRNEHRFIKMPVTRQEITALKAIGNISGTAQEIDSDEEAKKFIAHYQTLLLQKLYPQAYDCTIFPGVMIISTSFLTYKRDNWTFRIGGETWYQTREHLMKLKVDSETQSKLDTKGLLNSYGCQTQTHVGIIYHNPESDWKYTLCGSSTGLTDRMGEMITISFMGECYF